MKALASKNLNLRLVNKSDLHAIHALLIIPETDRFNTLGLPENIDVTRTILKSWLKDNKKKTETNYTFVIENKLNNNFIGLFGLNLGRAIYKKGEVWYKILPEYWDEGFATESLQRILNFAFNDLKLHRIEAGCAVENNASYKVMEKVGMQKEGVCRKVLPLENGWSDTFEYAILDTDKRSI